MDSCYPNMQAPHIKMIKEERGRHYAGSHMYFMEDVYLLTWLLPQLRPGKAQFHELGYRIYAGNVPWNWQVDDARLRQAFSEYGNVVTAKKRVIHVVLALLHYVY
ncbi:hypothetical protein K2173_020797 [Erythroxylum novogranatense]|uniref:RRM domain-containing protein n=1 Tax=Erythroxylum novogranatense TaxID=1862640 RepID=A0AAV8TLN8_9ROSI|nr:hypothetical protein K2173_020797 [Erythroxylum novogranatense]